MVIVDMVALMWMVMDIVLGAAQVGQVLTVLSKPNSSALPSNARTQFSALNHHVFTPAAQLTVMPNVVQAIVVVVMPIGSLLGKM